MASRLALLAIAVALALLSAAVTFAVLADLAPIAPTRPVVMTVVAINAMTALLLIAVIGRESWRIMQPLLDAPPPVHPYAPGSWGPAAADDLVAAYGGWQGPWVV